MKTLAQRAMERKLKTGFEAVIATGEQTAKGKPKLKTVVASATAKVPETERELLEIMGRSDTRKMQTTKEIVRQSVDANDNVVAKMVRVHQWTTDALADVIVNDFRLLPAETETQTETGTGEAASHAERLIAERNGSPVSV